MKEPPENFFTTTDYYTGAYWHNMTLFTNGLSCKRNISAGAVDRWNKLADYQVLMWMLLEVIHIQ